MAALPFARRYARALTGSQETGDSLVARALAGPMAALPGRLALFAGISRLAALPEPSDAAPLMLPVERQLLLLTALERMPLDDAALVVGVGRAVAAERLRQAYAVLKRAAVADVLIIEDEPVIAMELSLLMRDCGHRVVGIAGSEAEAVRMAAEQPLGLILADVKLEPGGNGIDAVRRILLSYAVPVIFVTAYAEMLLSAEGLEPAFVMHKPFDPLALAIFSYQATTSGQVSLR